MPIVRLDPHAHLYDCYSLVEWVTAAIRNLAGGPDTYRMVIVVDRAGQDSFARFRRESSIFRGWYEVPVAEGSSSETLAAIVSTGDCSLTVIRGVQYVTEERIEVLGFGVPRTIEEGAPCKAVIESILKSRGVPCIPWSPGKWLGRRGYIVKRMLESYAATELVFGDIAMRSCLGPPSNILSRARRAGYLVLPGTDPLPRVEDSSLVGSYGVQIDLAQLPPADICPTMLVRYFLSDSAQVTVWGYPNRPVEAIRRFIATV